MNALDITIAGAPLKHLVYHFVLPFSNWEHVTISYSESFESLSQGLQEALWALGAVPAVHRTDNLSEATHELIQTQGRDFTARYMELLAHYGMKPSKNQPGNAHKNGDVEQSLVRDAVDQRLRRQPELGRIP
jgi:transposase